MKALVIGGTGTISSWVVRRLIDKKWDVWVLNRGRNSSRLPEGVTELVADIKDEGEVERVLGNLSFDTVSEFTAFKKEDVERDYRLFNNRTKQYIFTSSASAYLKPLGCCVINEGTPLSNKYWDYSRDKIECEEYLMSLSREGLFNVTIVRPSHTYSKYSIPFAFRGGSGWSVISRMLKGKRVIIPGDGTTLWTLTHSLDFAKGYVGLMGNVHAYGEAFNIMGDEVLTWNQIYRTIADALDVELKPCYVSSDFLGRTGVKYGYDYTGSLLGDKANTALFDTSKLKRVVPEMSTGILFHEGIRDAVDYLLSHKELQREDEKFDLFSDRVIAAMDEAEKMV